MLHGWKSVCCVGTSYSIWETRVGEDELLHGWEKITEFRHSTVMDLSARFNGDLMHYWSGRQTRPNWKCLCWLLDTVRWRLPVVHVKEDG